MSEREASPPGLCCVLLTSDELLATEARTLCRRWRLPLLAVDTLDAVRGVLRSIVPSHLVLDARHGEPVVLDELLGALRPKVLVTYVHGMDTAMHVLAAISGAGGA